MRRRRPAPAGDTGASIVPLSRAHRGRAEGDDAATDGATALDRVEGTRSRFGKLTNEVTPHPDAARLKQPPRSPGRARRAKGGAERHTGWTFVLVPPGADARPRTLRVSVRRLRFAVASLFVLIGSTVATAGLLMLALNVMPPAQDEVRGVELGVFASVPTETDIDMKLDSGTTPTSIAAGSAGAGAPRTTTRPRTTRPSRRLDGTGTPSSHSIMESLPVVGEITSRFARARRHPLLGVVRRHAGIDIAAPAGTHILAPAAGRVRFSGKKFGYGYTVEIEHGGGVITRYAHCRSLMVRAGDDVAAGAIIATVGRSGLATAPHLHYEVMVNGRNVNPLQTQIASLLSGKQPAATASPPPADSALRVPVAPDATAAPDAPDEPEVEKTPKRPPTPSPVSGDTIASARIPTVRTPQVTVTESLPGLRPIPQVVVVDTARKS
jgi:murein DD-endopeptidase MepM/ murein hydrolase activator NlpD